MVRIQGANESCQINKILRGYSATDVKIILFDGFDLLNLKCKGDYPSFSGVLFFRMLDLIV